MARPKKNNAEYFSHDNHMRNDARIKALRTKFSHVGYSIWNMLLETLCEADNTNITIDEDDLEILSGDYEIESEVLNDVIEYLLRLKLIQRNGNVITCESLKKRIDPVLKKRKREREKSVLRERSESGVFEKIKSRNTTENKSGGVSAAEIPREVVNPPTDSPQSKVKESKVKESKESVTHTRITFGEKFKQNSQQVEGAFREAKRLNLFPLSYSPDDCKSQIFRWIDDYEPVFHATCPGADYSKFGYRFIDHIRDKAKALPEAKQQKQLSYSMNIPR